MVERHLAKVNVAGSNLVSRSKRICTVFSFNFLLAEQARRRYSQVVRPRSAKPLSPGSNPGGASKKTLHPNRCRVFKKINCRCGGIGRRKGLKIPRSNIRAGSSPASGTTKIVRNFLAIFFLPLVFYKGFLSCKIFWEIAKFG